MVISVVTWGLLCLTFITFTLGFCFKKFRQRGALTGTLRIQTEMGELIACRQNKLTETRK